MHARRMAGKGGLLVFKLQGLDIGNSNWLHEVYAASEYFQVCKPLGSYPWNTEFHVVAALGRQAHHMSKGEFLQKVYVTLRDNWRNAQAWSVVRASQNSQHIVNPVRKLKVFQEQYLKRCGIEAIGEQLFIDGCNRVERSHAFIEALSRGGVSLEADPSYDHEDYWVSAVDSLGLVAEEDQPVGRQISCWPLRGDYDDTVRNIAELDSRAGRVVGRVRAFGGCGATISTKVLRKSIVVFYVDKALGQCSREEKRRFSKAEKYAKAVVYIGHSDSHCFIREYGTAASRRTFVDRDDQWCVKTCY